MDDAQIFHCPTSPAIDCASGGPHKLRLYGRRAHFPNIIQGWLFNLVCAKLAIVRAFFPRKITLLEKDFASWQQIEVAPYEHVCATRGFSIRDIFICVERGILLWSLLCRKSRSFLLRKINFFFYLKKLSQQTVTTSATWSIKETFLYAADFCLLHKCTHGLNLFGWNWSLRNSLKNELQQRIIK